MNTSNLPICLRRQTGLGIRVTLWPRGAEGSYYQSWVLKRNQRRSNDMLDYELYVATISFFCHFCSWDIPGSGSASSYRVGVRVLHCVAMVGGGESKPMPIYKTFACSAVATCWAETCTLPIDTAKVRLQLQGAAKPGETLKYRGMLGTMSTIAKEEGVSALWAGLTPGLHRCGTVNADHSPRGQVPLTCHRPYTFDFFIMFC
jgi:hypothetical protein